MQRYAEDRGGELTADEIGELFFRQFATAGARKISGYRLSKDGDHDRIELVFETTNRSVAGHGSGPLEATVNALGLSRERIDILDYCEHAIGRGSDATAIAYVLLSVDGGRRIGMARAADSTLAALQAVINACPGEALPQPAGETVGAALASG